MGLHAMYDAMKTGPKVYIPPKLWRVEFYNPHFGPVRSQPDCYEYMTGQDAYAEAEKLKEDGITPVVYKLKQEGNKLVKQ